MPASTNKTTMAKKITALNINEAIDELEKEVKPITPDEQVCINKAKDYAILQFQARSDVKHTKQAMLSICWYNGYDLAAAFKEGVEWKLKKIVNRMYNFGYNYDSIAEALGIDCADVVDMLDLD